MTSGSSQVPSPWRSELTDVVRAVSGGLLFGIPLLYTMEVWWTGSHTHPVQALLALALTFVPVLLLNRTAGFRTTRDTHWREAMIDTVEALGIALILSVGVLVLLREITGDTSLRVGLGKVVYEAVPIGIGVGVAHHFLRGGRDETEGGTRARRGGKADRDGLDATLADIGATFIGTVFVAITIAPTDEVPMLAAAMSPVWLLAIMAASLAVSYAVVFAAGFAGEQQRRSQTGILQRPATETVVCYLVALASSALMLWFFQRGDGPWPVVLGRVVVLGLPAAVGGAAGRLAL